MGSVYSGPLYDQGYLRSLISFGSFMLVFGMFMTSLGTQYWHQILSQGLVMGLGLGCLFMSATAIVASYFTKRRGLAMGIASSGSTIGETTCICSGLPLTITVKSTRRHSLSNNILSVNQQNPLRLDHSRYRLHHAFTLDITRFGNEDAI